MRCIIIRANSERTPVIKHASYPHPTHHAGTRKDHSSHTGNTKPNPPSPSTQPYIIIRLNCAFVFVQALSFTTTLHQPKLPPLLYPQPPPPTITDMKLTRLLPHTDTPLILSLALRFLLRLELVLEDLVLVFFSLVARGGFGAWAGPASDPGT